MLSGEEQQIISGNMAKPGASNTNDGGGWGGGAGGGGGGGGGGSDLRSSKNGAASDSSSSMRSRSAANVKVGVLANASTTTTTAAAATTTATKTTTGTTDSSAAPAEPHAVVVHYFASFHHICVVTALLPLATLFTCFVTAYVFQYDDVHETHCRVYNIVPSISAITGISPQRYFWRLSIALHLGPRIPIAFVYKNYYSAQLEALALPPQQRQRIAWHIALILGLNCIEVAALGGVTYVSNRENYPMHEKIFITFMICSLCHMLATIKLNAILHGDAALLTEQQRASIKWKKILFNSSILSTIGLLIFFAKHRFYCHDLAFSWFAFFEYLIAVANMLFHFTIVWDFPSQYMLVVQGSRDNLQQVFNAPKRAN